MHLIRGIASPLPLVRLKIGHFAVWAFGKPTWTLEYGLIRDIETTTASHDSQIDLSERDELRNRWISKIDRADIRWGCKSGNVG
ncbi:MAG: hypothetical protein ACXQT5_01985 [Candidatus Syntropharchaeia archaeon]